MTELPEVGYPAVAVCPRCERFATGAARVPQPEDEIRVYAAPIRPEHIGPLVVQPCGCEVEQVRVYVGLGVAFSRSTELEVRP